MVHAVNTSSSECVCCAENRSIFRKPLRPAFLRSASCVPPRLSDGSAGSTGSAGSGSDGSGSRFPIRFARHTESRAQLELWISRWPNT